MGTPVVVFIGSCNFHDQWQPVHASLRGKICMHHGNLSCKFHDQWQPVHVVNQVYPGEKKMPTRVYISFWLQGVAFRQARCSVLTYLGTAGL